MFHTKIINVQIHQACNSIGNAENNIFKYQFLKYILATVCLSLLTRRAHHWTQSSGQSTQTTENPHHCAFLTGWA